MASDLSKHIFAVLAVCAIASSVMLIARQWKEDDRKARKAARHQDALDATIAQKSEYENTIPDDENR